MCLDFHKVNSVSQFDAYPMPHIRELLEKLGKATFLTTLDMTKGYWQIPLESESKEYTAFSTPLGLFQFKRMPFGLHGAAATFQRLVDKLLIPHSSYVTAYIDDVIIYSGSWEEHVGHVKAVVQSIGQAGLTVNPEKSKVGMRTTQYLGFVVGQGEVKRVRSKVEALQRDTGWRSGR